MAITPAAATPLSVVDKHDGAIGYHAEILKEGEQRLSLEDAIKAHAAGKFAPSSTDYFSFGIGASPRWLRFELSNNTPKAVTRRLSIETSWLDRIELDVLHQDALQASYHFGDALPYAKRPEYERFFVQGLLLKPGTTTLYLRVETPDPMVLPIYLKEQEALHHRLVEEGYSYGLVYGVLLSLLLYNLMLYFGLRSSRYLFYSAYLFFFLAMNLSYTGHGYQWFWPESPVLQRWLNPILMIAYAVSGLLFATRFLETEKALPRLHRITLFGSLLVVLAIALSVMLGGQVAALFIAFSFVLFYTVWMVLLGAVSLHAGNHSAKYFLYASIIAAIGATVTALTVWGLIDYSPYSYRAVELGTMIEAVLLALALASQFRLNQEAKLRAEQMARLDPLTGLNNRRSFYELVEPLWRTGVRHQHEMALVILDIDGFKQINDTYGHTEGDSVLEYTSRELKRFARGGDILARWGGEEFILFMPETGLEDAVKIAHRMRENIAAIRFSVEGEPLAFTASFGVAARRGRHATLAELITEADHYLYEAKRRGRNRVEYDHSAGVSPVMVSV